MEVKASFSAGQRQSIDYEDKSSLDIDSNRYKSGFWFSLQIQKANECMRAKDYQEAISMFEEAIQAFPKDLTAYNNLGFAYILMGEYEKAIPYLNQALAIDSYYPFGLNNKGFAIAQLGEIENGLELIKQSKTIKSDNSYAYRNEGFIFMREKRYSEALAAFLKARRLGYNQDYDNDIDVPIEELYKILSDTKRSD